jgi:DNA transformation protein
MVEIVPKRIEDMPSLGPATALMLEEVGIDSPAELREVGPVAAYVRLKFRFGRRVSILALYAMEAALQGIDWRLLDSTTKQRLVADVNQTESASSLTQQFP